MTKNELKQIYLDASGGRDLFMEESLPHAESRLAHWLIGIVGVGLVILAVVIVTL